MVLTEKKIIKTGSKCFGQNSLFLPRFLVLNNRKLLLIPCFLDICLFGADSQNIYPCKTTSLPPLTPNVEPQLNPNQPHHNMKVPNTKFVAEASCRGSRSSSNTPALKDKILI